MKTYIVALMILLVPVAFGPWWAEHYEDAKEILYVVFVWALYLL